METSNFYGLLKIQESKIREAALHSQNTEVIEVGEPSILKLRSIVGGPIGLTYLFFYTHLKPCILKVIFETVLTF